jgi:hypothetical protein
MTNITCNVVNDVVRCIERCSEHQQTLSHMILSLQAKEKEGASAQHAVLERALDMMKEIEIELCNLGASLVSAPISGRMFIPLPPEYIGKQEQAESLYAIMGQKHL